ncbi:MAG: hypothetical protein Tsb005_07720 [Gammaproteobacteria bacterium]
MKLGSYQKIDSHEIRQVFLDYFQALEIPIIDYLAIGVQDTIYKTSCSLMSSQEWQKIFYDQHFALYDPVRKAAFNSHTKFFAFDTLDFQDNYGKEIMRQRKLHGIENGLVFIRKTLGHNFMLTLATGYKGFAAYPFFIKYQQAINHIFDDLIQIIHSSTQQYQPKIYSSS